MTWQQLLPSEAPTLGWWTEAEEARRRRAYAADRQRRLQEIQLRASIEARAAATPLRDNHRSSTSAHFDRVTWEPSRDAHGHKVFTEVVWKGGKPWSIAGERLP